MQERDIKESSESCELCFIGGYAYAHYQFHQLGPDTELTIESNLPFSVVINDADGDPEASAAQIDQLIGKLTVCRDALMNKAHSR